MIQTTQLLVTPASMALIPSQSLVEVVHEGWWEPSQNENGINSRGTTSMGNPMRWTDTCSSFIPNRN